MLYERWRNIVSQFGPDLAMVDASDGRTWTFAQLCAEAERLDSPSEPIVFPQTNCPEFIFQVLRGWRWRKTVCPLEPGQQAPEIASRLSRADGIAHLKLTSATTGASKAVLFKPDQLAADADNLVTTMGLRPDWPNLGAISLAHSYGFSNLVTPLLLHGVPLVLARAALPEALKRAAANFDAITLAAVPALWRMWNSAKALPPQIRLAISAGAPLPAALEHSVFEECGLKIHNFYGSSECGGIAYDRSDVPRSDGACVGTPVDNVRIFIDEHSCVSVQSRAVANGYWPEPNARLANGIFRTSDLGELRADGLYLQGRVGDLINVAGRKVSPDAIESVLASHPGVEDCLAFGVPLEEGHRGENIVACIVLREGTSLAMVRDYCSHRLPAWQVPREWWTLENLETNDRGKISRTEWRERYLRQRPRTNSPI